MIFVLSGLGTELGLEHKIYRLQAKSGRGVVLGGICDRVQDEQTEYSDSLSPVAVDNLIKARFWGKPRTAQQPCLYLNFDGLPKDALDGWRLLVCSLSM